ncbi:BON domain-containing protein [Roseateles violae]|uniref:BON domain-containing protein n=1 Tax=Roseateles violae TaxID=3058042 RepID=A0ABT8DRH5_9BURK|nr:BON domain-containing protein [Pelomonas sp. PFR6]MDN3920648.1 BON domain-containing protein [Pelomonas sp. PFR6]
MKRQDRSVSRSTALIAAAALAGLALVGCDRPNDPQAGVGNRVDAAVDKAQQGANKVAASTEDAAITAKVKAELAKDPSLSALRINVDTQDGLVSLSGSAPDASAREHATRVAAAVKGVLSVDNRLVVNS